MYVSRSDSAKDCIKKALNSLPILENGDLGSTVNTNSDNTKNSVTSSISSDGSKSCDNNTHTSNNSSAANTPSKAISAYKKGEDEGGGGPEGSGEDQNGGQAAKSADYQLWVKTKFDESPYPLIGKFYLLNSSEIIIYKLSLMFWIWKIKYIFIYVLHKQISIYHNLILF